MTVSQAVPIIEYTGNGVSTAFAFDFRIFQALDLVVTVNGVEVTNYTVAITPQPAFGGTVTFDAAPAVGAVISIRRNLPFQRSVDYQQGGDLPEGTLDDDQDAPVMMIQQLAAGTDQRFGAVLRVPDGEAIATLPPAGSRANRVVGFDSTGQPIMLVPVGSGGVPEVDLGYTPALTQGTVTNTGGDPAVLPVFSAAAAGLVPAPVTVDEARFLRDDGDWVKLEFNEVLFRGYWYSKVSGWATDTPTDYGGPSYSSLTGTLVSPPAYSESTPFLSVPKAMRSVNTSGASAGWSIGIGSAVSGPRFCSAAGSGGFFLKMLFGTGQTVAPSGQITLHAGPRQTPSNFPSSTTDLTTSARAWFGIYKQTTDTNFRLGYKAAGTTSITDIADLGVAWGPEVVLYLSVLNTQEGIRYEVYRLTALKTLTLLASGFVSASIPRDINCAPGFNIWNSAVGLSEIFFSGHDFWYDLGGMRPI